MVPCPSRRLSFGYPWFERKGIFLSAGVGCGCGGWTPCIAPTNANATSLSNADPKLAVPNRISPKLLDLMRNAKDQSGHVQAKHHKANMNNANLATNKQITIVTMAKSMTMWMWTSVALAITVRATVIEVKNECRETVWPGILPVPGDGDADGLMGGGFELRPGQGVVLRPPHGWSGRLWGRTGCRFDSAGAGFCETGDCGRRLRCGDAGAGGEPPVSLAEFTLQDTQDFYDVSLVDGFNLPLSTAPTHRNCTVAGRCTKDVRAVCPRELAVRGSGGRVVACKSACYAFGTPQFCCTGAEGGPQTCKATAYSNIFKKACPAAYSYAYDDPSSLMTCSHPDYTITFCPSSSSSVSSAPHRPPAMTLPSSAFSASKLAFPFMLLLQHLLVSVLSLLTLH